MKAKSNLLVIVLTLFTSSIIAQNIEVTHQANGTVLSVPVQSIDSVIFQLVPPPSMKNIYQSNGNVLSIAMDDVDSITYVIPNPSLLPQVSTGSPTVLSSSSVYVDGNVTADGGSPVSQRGFCWSLSPNPTIANNTSQNGTGLGSFNQTVQPLSPSTTYYIRAYATNTEGTAYGNQVILTTSPANSNGGIPIIQTELIVYNDGLTAISGGNITDDGGLAVTSRGVCWAIGTTPTINNSITNDGSGAGSFQSNLTGLQPGTSYFARAYATNDAGTAYGITYSFTTNSLPVVNTVQYDNVTYYSALLFGELISSQSNIVSRGFYLSTSPDFLQNFQVIPVGNTIGTFSNQLLNLDASTTFYFRAYAESNVGTSFGNVLSFTTASTPVINASPGLGVVIGGENYSSVLLGNGQEWMSENVAYAFGNYVAYNNDNANAAIYGYLYDQQTAENICPTGWHLPTANEYINLINYLDPYADGGTNTINTAGGKMKSLGNTFWSSPNTGASNESGFSALPGGAFADCGGFIGIIWDGLNTTGVWRLSGGGGFSIYHNSQSASAPGPGSGCNGNDYHAAVRCIKD